MNRNLKRFFHPLLSLFKKGNSIKNKKGFLDEDNLYYHAFKNSPVGLYQTTPEGEIISANPAIVKMLGFKSLDDLLKRDLTKGSYVDDTKREKFKAVLEEKGEITNWESEWYTNDGEILYVREGAIAVRDKSGKVIRYDGAVEDITSLKRTQFELQKAKAMAEESEQLKTAFLANMSHEIRTPMNGILGFAELLKDAELNSDKQLQYIDIITRSGNRMLRIINQIITIAKIESKQEKVSYSEVDIKALVNELYGFFKTQAEEKGLKFSYTNLLPDEIETVMTDKVKVESVLSNLLNNSIKYTERGSITFGCKLLPDKFEFFVRDTGIGIPENRLNAIFDRFVQADIKDREAYEGAGLGLSISKAYADMLGGDISVKSEQGKGTTFTFTCPCEYRSRKAETSADKNALSSDGSHIRDFKVLIVEDDEISTKYLNFLMEDYTKNITCVNGGREAIDFCKSNSDIGLILMDIKMSGMNGLEATSQIRSFNKDVLIIGQSAYAMESDQQAGLDAGCNRYITKPISKKELDEILLSQFGQA